MHQSCEGSCIVATYILLWQHQYELIYLCWITWCCYSCQCPIRHIQDPLWTSNCHAQWLKDPANHSAIQILYWAIASRCLSHLWPTDPPSTPIFCYHSPGPFQTLWWQFRIYFWCSPPATTSMTSTCGCEMKQFLLRTTTINESSIVGNLMVHDDAYSVQLEKKPEDLGLYAIPSINDQSTFSLDSVYFTSAWTWSGLSSTCIKVCSIRQARLHTYLFWWRRHIWVLNTLTTTCSSLHCPRFWRESFFMHGGTNLVILKTMQRRNPKARISFSMPGVS